jgi:hypothetical protein
MNKRSTNLNIVNVNKRVEEVITIKEIREKALCYGFRITVFRGVILCSSLGKYQYFGGAGCLQIS